MQLLSQTFYSTESARLSVSQMTRLIGHKLSIFGCPASHISTYLHYILLSSPRAESARAVTGRQCPHSGAGRDFLAGNEPSRTKTGVTRQRSERFGRAQRLNGANAEGYKRPVDKNRGPISKNGFSGQNPEFLAPQKKYTFQF